MPEPLNPREAKYTEDILSAIKGRIAIVGNATPNCQFGELIDSYGTVIRLNNFRVTGFEKLVGTRVDYRCTTGWDDVEHRNGLIEFTPFTAAATESGNLEAFNRSNARPVLPACMDVHPLMPEAPKPSTGFALIQLCVYLGLPVDLFGFDGFKTPHYWDKNSGTYTTHSRSEMDFILKRPGVVLYGENYPYQALYDFCHKNHHDYDVNAGLELVRRLKKEFHGLKLLEFGAGNGDLSRHLEKQGNQVTAVEVSRHAFDRIVCTRKIQGTVLSLPLIKETFDCFVSVDVLEHLTENDCRLVIREAARLCKRIFVSVSTRPSGLLGPNGENLHLTVRAPSWWARQFGEFFDVQTYPGYGNGQLVIEGERKGETAGPVEAAGPVLSLKTAKPAGYSFCIITNGKRPQKLAEEIASIHALRIPVYEILVGGDIPVGLEGVRTLAMPEAAKGGRLGEMRNRLIEISLYDHLVMADDDMLFQPDFYKGLCEFGEDYEVMCVRLLNLDGSRFWDWATIGGPRGHRLIDYHETDSYLYVTGGFCVMKAEVAARVQWDSKRGFYQAEDVDFSRRLQAAGISIKFNRRSTVVHTDARYTQVGAVIMTTDILRKTVLEMIDLGHLNEARSLFEQLRAHDAAVAAQVLEEAPILQTAFLQLPVRWRGPIFNPSGYAAEAINFILPLSRRVSLGIQHFNNSYSENFIAGLKEEERSRLFRLRDKYPGISGGIVIEHNPANGFSCVPDAAYRIGRTMFETDRLGPEWVVACNQMDEVWVPSQFNVETFANSGVERDKLRVVPEAVDEIEFDPAKHEPLDLPHRARTNFLSIFEWSRRKGWDVLLAAYLREFTAEDDVCLYVRTYLFGKPNGDPGAAIEQRIREYAATLNLGNKSLPRIHVIAHQVPQAELPRLYKAADCLVAPSRGEGWGRPQHEAMLMELPVIATNWSGNTEFMTAENSFLLDYEIAEASSLEAELWHYSNHRWAEPSETSLRQAMRRVQQQPEEARARGRRARQDMVRRYSRAAVADIVVARLQEIERKLVTPVCPAVTARAVQPVAPSATPNPTRWRVTWDGSFHDLGSLSHVNRELTSALSARHSLQITRVSQNKSAVPPKTDVTVRHEWPPKWNKPATGAWVLIQPWEFGVLPQDWVKKLHFVDEIWAPTEYVRRVYVESGIQPSKVKIVPNGIDPEKFRPDLTPLPLATRKKFKFLFVGGTIHRKGPDVLLKSYLESFTAADDVCLVIKDFGGRSFYQGQTMEQQIAAFRQRPNAPEILYLTDDLKSQDMPRLYVACQCLVHPYRGEGFGLPVLEAMACGLAVVVTGGGATDDFATDEYAWRLPALRQSIGAQLGDIKLLRNGWLLEPVQTALSERLRWIAANPEEARTRGRAASDYVRREWTWERAASIAAVRLQQLAQRAKTEATAQRAPQIALPDCGKVGALINARDFVTKKNYPAAWDATVAAIQVRPHHPEAYLLLGRLAQTDGDNASARRCGEYSAKLAPGWKPAKQFLKSITAKNGKTTTRNLPDALLEKTTGSPRLSVCLIVKNEEQFLDRCLQSVCDIARQIVVVDTGSTDRTVEIAKKFNAEVYYFTWNDDFSAARNKALIHATGDWVLSIDADEELMPEHKKTILAEMQSAKVMGYRLPIFNHGQEQEGCGYVPRLFRNAPGLFFVGRVHEEIFSSLESRANEWGLELSLGKSALLHRGYQEEIVANRGKIERNLRLLQMAVEEIPDSPSLVMNLGLELIRSGHFEAGLGKYVEAVRLIAALPAGKVTPEFSENLLTQLTTNLLGAARYGEIVEFWQQPFPKSCGMTASQHFMLGMAYIELKQPAAAAGQMRQCLAKRNQPVFSPINKHILTVVPRHFLALCLAGLGQRAEAEQAFKEAMQEDPKLRALRFDFAKFQFKNGQPVEALKLANQLAAEDSRDLPVWQFGGQIALSQTEFLEFARNWTGEAIKHFPQDSTVMLQRAEALLLSQQVDSALPLWTQAHVPNSTRHLAALVLCELLEGRCHRQFPHAAEKLVSQEFLKWYRQLIKSKADSIVNNTNENLEELRLVLPSAAAALSAALKRADAAVAV